ncbi:MAG: serine/threonine-protein kinase [Victivallales bacterium]
MAQDFKDDGQENFKETRKSTVTVSHADTEEQKKKTSLKIPAPAPKGGNASQPEADDEPMSSETISIKRSTFVEKEEEPRKEPAVPEKRLCKITCYKCAQKLDLTELEPFSKVNCPSCNVEIIVPKWFDNYLLEEPGGVGGMAVVYRALDLTLDREVAIKVLNPDVASQTDRSHLFLHEARTAATVNHYAVLPIYTCGEFEGQPYIVMQFMDGGSLDKKLEENKEQFPISDVVKWIRDVAEGLDNARRHGIIHHDIKPANIMMDKDGNVKVGDFGIAQAMRDSRSESIAKLTKSWASPHYVSPEKVLEGKEDHMGDIYSLGATFYQLLTKQTPFDKDDIDELVRIRTVEDPPLPKKHRSEIPQTISDLIMKMMSRKPDARPTYRDIVSCLNTLIKENDKKKDAKEKHVRKNVPAALKKSVRAFGEKPGVTASHPKGNPWIMFGIHVAISLFMIIGAYVVWQMGLLDKFLYKGGRMPKDFLADATKMFKAGDCREAARIAERVLNDGTARIAARKQAGIQLALAKYLANDPEAKKECASIYEKLVAANVNEEDPSLEILRYLGGSSASPKSLKDRIQVEDNKYFEIISAQSFYVRNIYDKGSCIELMGYSNSYMGLIAGVPDEYWGCAWKERVPKWKEWTEEAKGDPSKLEDAISDYKVDAKDVKMETKTATPERQVAKQKPVDTAPVAKQKPVDTAPVANNTAVKATPVEKLSSTFEDISVPASEDTKNLNLSDLKPDMLKSLRAFAANRPRPADYNFNQAVFSTYLQGIPEAKRPLEEGRFKQVTGIKSYIASLMERNSYDKPLVLKSGRIVSGGLMLNDRFISIKNRGGKYDRLEWDALPPGQICQILEYFANFRLSASGGVTVSKTKQKREAAEDFLRIGIFCDWYGDYNSAVKYALKAYDTDPSMENTIKKYMMQ